MICTIVLIKYVNWVEGQRTQNFRSAMELLKLIDGALDENVDIKGGNYEE